MKRLPSCLAAALLSLALASAAVAQTETSPQPRVIGGPLAGVDVLQMSLAPLSEQARACGLGPNLILDSFKQPLKEQNIVLHEAAHVWPQLQATPPRSPGGACLPYTTTPAVHNTRYIDRPPENDRHQPRPHG